MRKSFIGLGLAVLTGLLLTAAASPELRVQVQTGKLSVQAHQVPLDSVLWAISAQTGITLSIMDGMQQSVEVHVMDDFTDLPLRQGIIRLLEKHLQQPSYTIISDEKTGEIKALHLLSGTSAVSVPAPVADEKSTPDPANNTAGQPTVPEQELSELDAQIVALRALKDFKDPDTLKKLRPALQSRDKEVRKAALEAMRSGPVDDVKTLGDVRSMAASDTEPEVREAALDVLVEHDDGSSETRTLLEDLAAEEEGLHSDFARTQLRRMEEEAAERGRPPEPQGEVSFSDIQLEQE